MNRKSVEVFESDYDKLMIRAGQPNKIAFVVQNLIKLSEACSKDLDKLNTWIRAVEDAS